MKKENIPAYEIVKQEKLTDIHSTGYLVRHKKTGARLVLIENDDENKVFSIAFRTTPKNSTGVPHILEHSVLCGSREFPLKDPFVELVKGSLNTFLNAMTYPDKTCYPVASCNDQDFQNLMHVYLDAVFYPNIYQKEEIFRQEGWSYQLDSVEDKLKYNGVVYNEMKGAFSSPEGVLDRVVLNTLFPDTSYANESGGDPEVIPELTYEQFMLLGDKELSRRFSMQDEAEQKAKIDREQANELEYVDESQKSDTTECANSSNGSAGTKPVRNPEREKPKWEDTITNRMLHWSYTPEQKEEVKKALAAGVPKATILTYFYPEVTVEKMSSYRKKQ